MNRTMMVKAYVLPEEKEEVVALASQAHLTTSELIRRLILGRRLPNVKRYEAVLDLVQINADLARLGNLLRMALSDEDFKPPENMSLEVLFENIEMTHRMLRTKIKEL